MSFGGKPPHEEFIRVHQGMRPPGVDVSAGYMKMGVDTVRIHDFIGAGDIDSPLGSEFKILYTDGQIVPSSPAEEASLLADLIFPDWNADPNDPRNYNFGPTDRIVKSIIQIGAEVYFRIGRGLVADASPPSDLKKYAVVVSNIIRHYNEGWGNGFEYNIRNWEIWNEPDMLSFWSGTAEQYFELYKVLSKAIKSVDATLKVGGPTIVSPTIPSAYRDDFINYVMKNNLPLDFLSWHLYSGAFNDDPDVFSTVAKKYRSLLDKSGLDSTKIILSEWNSGYGSAEPLDEAEEAAFLASVSISMQDAPIDQAMVYRADAFVKSDGLTLDKRGQAFSWVSKMQDTPIRLSTNGGDDAGFGVLAGRSKDGKLIQVMISNYQMSGRCITRAERDSPANDWAKCRNVDYENNEGYDLKLDGMPMENGTWRLTRYRITYGIDGEMVEERDLAEKQSIELSAILPPPGIDFIVLRQE